MIPAIAAIPFAGAALRVVTGFLRGNTWLVPAASGLLGALAVAALVAWYQGRLAERYEAGRADERKEWQAAVSATDAANARRDLEQREAREERQRQVISGLTEAFTSRGLEIDGYASMEEAKKFLARGINERDLADLRRLYGPWVAPRR